jgi:hypothetical protein
MLFVACCAEELGVTGRIFLDLPALLFVAGKAGAGDIGSKLHINRGMRVRVAGVASANLIVGLAGVARAACRDDFLFTDHRRMSFMAVHTADSSLVFRSLAFHCLHYCGMAFDAVSC